MAFDVKQEHAIDLCLDMEKRLVSVTGEAGTGKTTLIKRICDKLTEREVKFALTAPTAKAARRIREATGYPAQTIHKLLAFNRPELNEETGKPASASKPSFNKQTSLPYDIVICDEYAMVNSGLHRDLVDALGKGALRLFGDVRQLPPIEQYFVGSDITSPFERCLKSKHTIVLDTIYRQAEGNGILEAGRAINRGNPFASSADCIVKFSASMLKDLFDMVRADPVIWGSLDNQIISPARNKSDVCTKRMNPILQTIINPAMQLKTELPRHKWDAKERMYVCLDDKVVCTDNIYDMRDYFERYEDWSDDITPVMSSFIPCPDTKQVLNGEVGRVVAIGPMGELEIDFGDRIVEMPTSITEYSYRHKTVFKLDVRKAIEHAYALTTHKCQGSEYKNIAYIMAGAIFFNLSRPNFYTAVTRARQRALVFTDQKGFATALRKTGKDVRK